MLIYVVTTAAIIVLKKKMKANMTIENYVYNLVLG